MSKYGYHEQILYTFINPMHNTCTHRVPPLPLSERTMVHEQRGSSFVLVVLGANVYLSIYPSIYQSIYQSLRRIEFLSRIVVDIWQVLVK
jgi:hypothetical protein